MMDAFMYQRVQHSLLSANQAIGHAPFEMQEEAEELVAAATEFLGNPLDSDAQEAYEDADARYNSAAVECGWL